MYKVGQKVKVSSSNDNDNYEEFKNEVLIITHIATSEKDHTGYDNSMEGMQLMDFETESGKEVNCSLYEYEIEPA
jgi:hypothetical protein